MTLNGRWNNIVIKKIICDIYGLEAFAEREFRLVGRTVAFTAK